MGLVAEILFYDVMVFFTSPQCYGVRGDVRLSVLSGGCRACLALLGVAFFDRHEARAIEISERDLAAGAGEVELSQEYWDVSKRVARVGRLASLLIVVAVFFMTVKP